MVDIKQAVILAGGLGTRLRPLTYKIPKPMVPVNNRPFLEYLIEMLRENGISEVVFLLGYLPEKIVEYFGDGSEFGVNIKYSIGDVSFETEKRIKNAEYLLDGFFLLMYCDNYWPLNLKKMMEFYNKNKTLVTMVIYTNKDNITRNNVYVDENGWIRKYDKTREDKNLNGVDIGFFIVNKKVLNLMSNHNFSFQDEILPKLIEKRQIRGYLTDHRYYSISTHERLILTENFLKPKKVIFLDRDGVINKKPPKADYVKKWAEFEFLPGAIEAIKLLTQNDYDIYVITNQPGIARGLMSKKDLENIHENLKKKIEKYGGKITGIYSCTHGWNEECECRKPKPGMLFQASKDHSLDLTKIIFIGDDECDFQAGDAAGCKTILVTPENNLLKIVNSLLEPNTEVSANYRKLFDSLLKSYFMSNKKRFIVSIGGCAQSGKTTLAEKIKKHLNKMGIKCIVVSLDNWILDLNERKGDETVRERFLYKQISEAIALIKEGNRVYAPIYDPKTRSVISKKSSTPISIDTGICIVDGVVALDIEELRKISDFKIFVDVSNNIRKSRLKKFYIKYKKCSLYETKDIIKSRELEEVPTIKKTKKYADILYNSGESIDNIRNR
jgi:D-glycero-D-manno-heptose 1,7-bisphosphate phosphatase